MEDTIEGKVYIIAVILKQWPAGHMWPAGHCLSTTDIE